MLLSGNTAAGVLLYIFFNFLVVILEALLRVILVPMLYGFTNTGFIALKFSPMAYLMSDGLDKMFIGYSFTMELSYIVILSAVRCLLLLLSWFMYQRRQLESVGEFVAPKKFRPVIQYLVTLVCALGFGILTAEILLDFVSIDYATDLMTMILVVGIILIMGFVAFIVSDMVLKKTLRVFKKNLFIQYAGFAIILTGVIFGFRFDVAGLVTYIPQAQQVESVEISNHQGNVVLKNVDEIQAVIDAQKLVIDGRMDKQEEHITDLRIVYTLLNGSVVEREYMLYEKSSGCHSEGTAKLYDILTNDKAAWSAFLNKNPQQANIETWSNEGYITLTAAQRAKLMECLEKDYQNGNFNMYRQANISSDSPFMTLGFTFSNLGYENYLCMQFTEEQCYTFEYLCSLELLMEK